MNVLKVARRYSTQSGIKKQICIVGSGPAGFYSAQYLLKHLPDSQVDIIEKLPVPFGLVRFGVAPDHPEVKNVISTFTKTAENKNVRFLGNLALGKDFSLKELRERYHAVLLTYGADQDRYLGIPNENQENVLSARQFVAWYNGLPGAKNFNPNLLNCKTVAIIGQGNVAIDVARILLSPIDAIKTTDITSYALDALSKSSVEKVYLVGRRGPLQAAYTIKELREMLKLEKCNTVWKKDDFVGVSNSLDSLARPKKRLTELMLKSLDQSNDSPNTKTFNPLFFRSPKSINQNALLLAKTKLDGETAVETGETETIEADLILRSIGYKSSCVDKDINFDPKRGVVKNINGRVMTTTNEIDKGLYVSGWLATGPTGVIVTTMNNSFNVADTICKDFNEGKISVTESKSGIDMCGKENVITWDKWKKIDSFEKEAGKILNKPREKIVDVNEMINVSQ